jgi:hypothetical protein
MLERGSGLSLVPVWVLLRFAVFWQRIFWASQSIQVLDCDGSRGGEIDSGGEFFQDSKSVLCIQVNGTGENRETPFTCTLNTLLIFWLNAISARKMGTATLHVSTGISLKTNPSLALLNVLLFYNAPSSLKGEKPALYRQIALQHCTQSQESRFDLCSSRWTMTHSWFQWWQTEHYI